MIKRIFLIVLDSLGVGFLPDAPEFGDEGANTLGSIARSAAFDIPNLRSLGMGNIPGVEIGPHPSPVGCYGKMAEAGKGKDTVTGHWEIAGVISSMPMPTYPDGFPQRIVDCLSRATGRGMLCNKAYSGTQVLLDYGREHVETGALILYTSADSVMQIAAHEDAVPVKLLYEYCEAAREIMTGEDAVGRIIARPFIGTYPNYVRTPNRHDIALAPPGKTMMDVMLRAGLNTVGVGKIYDIFAGRGINRSIKTSSNDDGMEKTIRLAREDFEGLCFVNLVDFDMKYGHRNDTDGYARALTDFDRQLRTFMDAMREDDMLIITADHGCDPGFPGTDHTREYVPLLVYGKSLRSGADLSTRSSFCDVAATVLDVFNLPPVQNGVSFRRDIM